MRDMPKPDEESLNDEDGREEKEEEDLGYYGHILKKRNVELSEEEERRIKEENEENILSVAFKTAEVKEIISPHSFSILANKEPHVELAEPVIAEARNIFRHELEKTHRSESGSENHRGRLPRASIVPMLVAMGYDQDQDIMLNIVDKIFFNEDLDIDEWCMLLEDYHAPAYNYGQILRKYCGRGEVDKVKELVARGCDVNTGDGEGLTPLHYAAELNRVSVINVLYSLGNGGLNINAQDKYGWSPLHSAAHQGNTDAVQALLKLDADVNIMDLYGKTPMHYAAAQGRNRICDMLLAKCGDILNKADIHGMTPLHETAYKSRESTYAILGMVKGVDIDCKDVFGNTAASYADLV